MWPFVLQGSDCFYILLFSPEMCHHSQTQCRGSKKGHSDSRKRRRTVAFGHWWQKGAALLQVMKVEGDTVAARAAGNFLTLSPSASVTLQRSSLTLPLRFQSRVSYTGEFHLLQKGYYISLGVFYSIPQKYRKTFKKYI